MRTSNGRCSSPEQEMATPDTLTTMRENVAFSTTTELVLVV